MWLTRLHKRGLLRARSWLLVAGTLCTLTAAVPSSAHETLTTTVYFDREIVRILNKHCVMCHNQQGSSFPLETYEQTWLAGRKIRAAVIGRHMPPWAAVPGYGDFANENSLTLREVQFVVSWVEGLGPRNGGTVFTNVANSDTPREPIRARWNAGQWKRGVPSLTLPVEAVNIPRGTDNMIRKVVVSTGLQSAQSIDSIEYQPGDPRSVRAVFLTIQETGQWIGSWTPWFGSIEAPPNAAFRLPANAHIVAELHLANANGSMEKGQIGLHLSEGPAVNTISDLTVPQGAVSREDRFRSEVTVMKDTHVVAIRLEPSSAARSVEVSERTANGQTRVLLFAKDFAADWPSPFILKMPSLLRRGSALTVTSYGSPVKVTLSRY